VQGGDDVGPGDGQQLVAALERRAAEVVGRQVAGLEVGARRPVEDDDALAQEFEERECFRRPVLASTG
jgi:hypothetical protein